MTWWLFCHSFATTLPRHCHKGLEGPLHHKVCPTLLLQTATITFCLNFVCTCSFLHLFCQVSHLLFFPSNSHAKNQSHKLKRGTREPNAIPGKPNSSHTNKERSHTNKERTNVESHQQRDNQNSFMCGNVATCGKEWQCVALIATESSKIATEFANHCHSHLPLKSLHSIRGDSLSS